MLGTEFDGEVGGLLVERLADLGAMPIVEFEDPVVPCTTRVADAEWVKDPALPVTVNG